MRRVEEQLGRAFGPGERHSVDALYDLRADRLAEVAALLRSGRIPAVQYLQYVVRHSHLDHVADFLDQVVVGGADISTWGRRDQFCTIEMGLASLVRLTVADLVALVAPVGAGRWVRVVPDSNTWDHTSFCGAPGVVRTATPYWWTCDEPLSCIDARAERLEPVDDLEIAFRRWLASRIAWQMRGRARPSTLAEWQGALGVSTMSTDARLAIHALLAESGDGPAGLPPGFRAPDQVLRGT